MIRDRSLTGLILQHDPAREREELVPAPFFLRVPSLCEPVA